MTLVKNPDTGRWEGDFKDRSIGRLHLSLRTKKVGEARTRHAAVEALIAQGYTDLVARLRKGAKPPLKIEAVERVHLNGGRFDELRERVSDWPTFGVAVEQYLAALAAHPHRAKRTHVYASQMLGVAVDHFGADRALDSITGDDVLAFQTMLREERRVKDGTLGNYLIRLGALYRWVQTRENRRAREGKRAARTLYSPVDRDLVPKHRGQRVRFLSEEEATRLYVAAPPEYRFVIALGIFAGLRLMEALSLRPAPLDVDLELGLVHVQEREAPDAWAPKGRRNRDVPMSSELRRAYERHVAAGYAGEYYLTPAPPALHPSAHKETKAGGGMWSASRFRRTFVRIVKDAGLSAKARDPMCVSFHTLRHTFASWLVMEGVDLFTVSRLMGHTTTTQVERTYGHLAPEHKRRAVERLAARLHLPLDPAESPEAT